jgi:hypothetical protein
MRKVFRLSLSGRLAMIRGGSFLFSMFESMGLLPNEWVEVRA